MFTENIKKTKIITFTNYVGLEVSPQNQRLKWLGLPDI